MLRCPSAMQMEIKKYIPGKMICFMCAYMRERASAPTQQSCAKTILMEIKNITAGQTNLIWLKKKTFKFQTHTHSVLLATTK